jgi:hypothetical protein
MHDHRDTAPHESHAPWRPGHRAGRRGRRLPRWWPGAVCLASALTLYPALPAAAASPAPATKAPASALCPAAVSRGWCGDGGPATAALLNDPHEVAPLPTGGFLIADTGNNVIREVSAAGVISTVAGTPMQPGDSGDGGPAAAAKLDQPMGVAVLPGGAFAIADTGNHVIRVVSPQGTITTLGSAGDFNQPRSLAVLGDGALLVADASSNRVLELSTSGELTTFAGTGTAGRGGDGGPATTAQLDYPTSVALDAAGDVLIADSGNRVIRSVDPDGTITTALGLAGPAASPPVAVAVAVAADGSLLAGDGATVTSLGADGIPEQIAGTKTAGFDGDAGAATAIMLGAVNGLATASDGSLLISDGADDRIRELASDGELVTVAGSGQPRPPQLAPLTINAGSAPPQATAGISDGGSCPGLPSEGAYAVSFPYYPPSPIPAGTHATVKVYSSADAYLTLTVTPAHGKARSKRREISTNSTTVALGTLKRGTYKLSARARYAARGRPPTYSCYTASLKVS